MMKKGENMLRKFDPFMTGLLNKKLGGKREPLSCLSMILLGVRLTCRLDGPKISLKNLNWSSIFNPRQDRLSSLFPATILEWRENRPASPKYAGQYVVSWWEAWFSTPGH